MSSKYIKVQNSKSNSMKCPKCSEKLLHVDIEMFNQCPYCDYNFPENNEFEDFILQPIVEEWTKIMTKNSDFSKKDRINL
ncbi:hypothetical protein AAEX28_03255 [Lentisphaerota bacterium WC36G]|nr:hypothetical protein LJT99_06130 [Lentisphaerae bacterium WC36]